MTPEERESIILEAIERALLLIPETMGSLMTSHAALNKQNTKFLSDHPEFRDHKDAVMSVVEMVESKNPLLEYPDILKKAVPDIRKRIKTLKRMDAKNVSRTPDRQFERIDSAKVDNPHGVI